jgi:hypothetical protein
MPAARCRTTAPAVEAAPATNFGKDLAIAGQGPRAMNALCAEIDQFGACRWPSCIVLGPLKKGR